MVNCYEKAESRIKAIANLQRDIAGEKKAIEDYLKSITDLGGRRDTNLANTKIEHKYINKLLEIQQEERHHLDELEMMGRDSFFWIREALEDFADCECAQRCEVKEITNMEDLDHYISQQVAHLAPIRVNYKGNYSRDLAEYELKKSIEAPRIITQADREQARVSKPSYKK